MEFTYDSDAEREGRDRASATPPYNADTELAEYTARSAERRADTSGAKDVYVSPRTAHAERYSGGEYPRTAQAESDEETLHAHSTRMDLSVLGGPR